MPRFNNYFCYNHYGMILVSGGTGFIGSVLVRHLSELGLPVRILIHPSKQSPKVPKGIPVEIGVSSLNDDRGLRAVLKGVDTVFHLASSEAKGTGSELYNVEVKGTSSLCAAAKDAGVRRFIYLSHLGADRFSAYPLLKAKGIAEYSIIDSGLTYTIIRSAVVFGKNDRFTTNLAELIKKSPGIVLLPEDGNAMIQPVWIEDVVTCLVWSMEIQGLVNQVIKIGGPEYFSFKDVISILMRRLSINRYLVNVSPVILRKLTEAFESLFKRFPTSIFWIDYLAEDRVCELNSISNHFGFVPARFEDSISYLQNSKRLQGKTKR